MHPSHIPALVWSSIPQWGHVKSQKPGEMLKSGNGEMGEWATFNFLVCPCGGKANSLDYRTPFWSSDINILVAVAFGSLEIFRGVSDPSFDDILFLPNSLPLYFLRRRAPCRLENKTRLQSPARWLPRRPRHHATCLSFSAWAASMGCSVSLCCMSSLLH